MFDWPEGGASRLCEMGLSDGIWKVWRNAPGFWQRFMGRFSDDGRRIQGRWEKSGDGAYWARDFDLTYTKVR